MKRFLLLCLLILATKSSIAQKSYIQVTGEPDLSVFLDNQFKGKTTVEFNGFIIENVSPGTHLIKIIKTGYTPFEENITVKAGEVFAYKVKPFTKQTVTISESGNSGEAVKQMPARTGKLIVQSVPIEIKITIPSIDGVKNISKTKDEWKVNDIPVGRYEIMMSFGTKTVKKEIEVSENDITNVFVNMVSGEFSSKISLSPEKIKANNESYFKSVLKKYRIARAATLADFYAQTPGSSVIAQFQERNNTVWISVPEKAILKNPTLTPGPRFLGYDRRGVKSYDFALKGFDDYNTALQFYTDQLNEFKRNIDPTYLITSNSNSLGVSYQCLVDGKWTLIGYRLNQVGKGSHYEVIIHFGMY